MQDMWVEEPEVVGTIKPPPDTPQQKLYAYLPKTWQVKVERLSKFLARRRRHITLKFAAAAAAVTLLLIGIFLWIAFTSSRSGVPEELQMLRKKALKENTDEFFVPVARDFSFYEVDLFAIAEGDFEEYDQEIENDERRIEVGLGEGGLPGTVPPSQEKTAQEVKKKEAFNRILGDMISLNRSTPDTREEACQSEIYDTSLPDMSVVIIFAEEALSSLLRTVHSVVNRTPPKFLKEIILVDDSSTKADLKGKLARYLSTKFDLRKIRLVRVGLRSGLIRARMIGAHIAVGEVIVFLDAHCETTIQWAEPLLQRIKDNRKAVVCPVIDVIDDKTLEYGMGNGGTWVQIGGFTWSGDFTWINVPSYEKKRKVSNHSPTRSPTMAGGLFAIERKYFWEIGSYDPGMQFWGGENLEISFRIWQCGGSLEVIPCSHVGHIFREFQPYSFPNNVDSHGLNTARMAEVWMDEFKELFYSYRKKLKHKDIGDITSRLAFRRRNKCKSFKWFLDNIYKEKYRLWHSAKEYGQFKNEDSGHCLDDMQHSDSREYGLSVYPCHAKLSSSQTFSLSRKGELRKEDLCASELEDGGIQMIHCQNFKSTEKWDHKSPSGQLVHLKSKKCLTVLKAEDEEAGYSLALAECEQVLEDQGEEGVTEVSLQKSFQRWIIDRHEDDEDEGDVPESTEE